MDDIKVVEPGDLPPADVIDPVIEPDGTAAVSEADLVDTHRLNLFKDQSMIPSIDGSSV